MRGILSRQGPPGGRARGRNRPCSKERTGRVEMTPGNDPRITRISANNSNHNSSKSCNSNKILAAKEHKERRDKNLWCFSFVIFAFFVVNSVLVAARRPGLEWFKQTRSHSPFVEGFSRWGRLAEASAWVRATPDGFPIPNRDPYQVSFNGHDFI